MKIHAFHLIRRRKSAAGFTLVEMMTSVALGLILLVGVAILYINGNESFVAMANYQNLDKYSCNALDILTREIRGCSAVTAYTANQSITLNNVTLGKTVNIAYDSTGRTLILTTTIGGTATTVTNLTGCDSWTCSMFTGVPIISTTNVTFTATSSASSCKVIQMNWKCSRTYLGAKLQTESVQTAQIVLRNEVTN
jgi:prepilin-type N-terminal cleavage/methylation domain-containing protein